MKNKITTYMFLVLIFGISILNILVKDKEISFNERRYLQKFPEITFDDILDKDFMEDFDNYMLDQFALREDFRSLKAFVTYNIFNKVDNNKIYIKDGMIFKSEYPTNKKSINNFIEKINLITEKYLTNNNVFYSIIPDKNYYINDNKYLNIDYEYLYNEVNQGLETLKYIELRDVLSLNDYYKTDTHWKQENLEKVVDRFGIELNFTITHSYEKKSYEPFYGVYYGQSAMKLNPDKIYFLTNSMIDSVKVDNYEKDNVMYNTNKLTSLDAYDVYLSGSTPLITLYNPNQQNGKELIIFRDSFGSSLAPLLSQAYEKITLIDLRYMNTKYMEKLVEFNNQDVLFLYSTLIVNNSSSIKV